MNSSLTPALEDYVETIYILGLESDGKVKVQDIAERLSVTMASVTGGMRKLAAMQYIQYEKRRYVELTDMGRKMAEEVYRRHQELFRFYHEALGVSEKDAMTSACRVEHYLSSAIIEKTIAMKKWLEGLPPELKEQFNREVRDANVEERGLPMTLDRLPIGNRAVIRKIHKSGEIGRRILDMGITKGAEVEVVRAAPLGDPIDIKVMGYHLSLRRSEAARIEVESLSN